MCSWSIDLCAATYICRTPNWRGNCLKQSCGARGGGRTRMALRPRDFKSLAYTSFATRACAHGAAAMPWKEAAVQTIGETRLGTRCSDTTWRLSLSANVSRLCRDRKIEVGQEARSSSNWRPRSELNRRTRLCRPLHNHSATRPRVSKNVPRRGRLEPYAWMKNWSGKRDSNSRPRPWQGRALPTELFPHETRKDTDSACRVNFHRAARAMRRADK